MCFLGFLAVSRLVGIFWGPLSGLSTVGFSSPSGLPDASYDVVTLNFLLHELPLDATRSHETTKNNASKRLARERLPVDASLFFWWFDCLILYMSLQKRYSFGVCF